MQRQVPKPANSADLLKFKKPTISPRSGGWHGRRPSPTSARSPVGSRPRHRSTTPTVRRRRSCHWRGRVVFRDIEFHPAILRDVLTVDTSCQIAGGRSAMPFGIAPTGFTRIHHRHRRRSPAAARPLARRGERLR